MRVALVLQMRSFHDTKEKKVANNAHDADYKHACAAGVEEHRVEADILVRNVVVSQWGCRGLS